MIISHTNPGVPSQSTAFLLPQWGGIVLFNPPPLTAPHSHIHLSPQDLYPIMNSFTSQLLALLGVPPLPPTVRSIQPDSVLTDWQLDALLRRRIRENVQKSTETLRSIVQLVAQIENMPVGADVRGDVLDALSALDKVGSHYPDLYLCAIIKPIAGICLIVQLVHTNSPLLCPSPHSCLSCLFQSRYACPTIFPCGTQVRGIHATICECRGAAYRCRRERDYCVETPSEREGDEAESWGYR
jgi:hypothetical protein